jgi:hypothetical protein
MRLLAQWLRRLADWCDPPPPRAVLPGAFFDRVRVLVKEAEMRLGAGFGDAKRRDVYARLMKDFPETPKREIALAIEQVVQEAA